MSFTLENNPLFNTAPVKEKPKEEKKPDKKPNKPERSIGRPQNANIVRDNSVQEGLTKDFTRATFIIEVDLLERMKNLAYTERKGIKETINDLLRKSLDSEEKKLKKEGIEILDRNGGNKK